MARPAHRSRSVLREVRATLIRAGAGFGLLAGVWYGLAHHGTLRDCPVAKGPHAGAAVMRCVARGTSALGWHWALILGAGTLLGLAVGVLLASMVPLRGGGRSPRAERGRAR